MHAEPGKTIDIESTFTTHDGLALYYRARLPHSSRGAIVLMHRGHEHSGRMFHLADELGLADFAFFAYDARGLGRSPGPRGDAPDFATLTRDLATFVDHVRMAHGIPAENTVVVAQSVGAVVASAYAHDYAPKLRGLVLASPAFSVKLYVPFAREGLSLMHKLFGNFFVNSYVKASFLTHDAARIESYTTDPLITRPISVRILLGLYDTADRLVSDANAITTPVQMLVSGDDWVVRHEPQFDFFKRLPHPRSEQHILPGFYHDTLGEKDREQALVPMRRFITRLFDDPPERLQLKDADRRGATFDEAQDLAAPLPKWSLRGMYWAMTRFGIRLGARLSRGIAVGEATGHDSGSTLDYVYRNEAKGVPIIGGFIDRAYLDSIGWRGIRLRKIHLQELLVAAAARQRDAGQPVRIVDIAAGHGRYVIDAISSLPQPPDSVLLRDYSDINVRDGQSLIDTRGLKACARFINADAFDRNSIAATDPKPTLGIVSGLYELFADNTLVGRSLAGLADAIPKGGYLLYTGQPWHPQLELIARALTSHRQGQAWVMRRRTQAEMDQLVEAAGFRKIDQRIDPFGIFTVSLAVRQ